MEKVNLAFTGDCPPLHSPTTGTFVTTCFYLQLAYFQQPIPNMRGPLFKNLLSNTHTLYRKENDQKERTRKKRKKKKRKDF